MAPKRSTPKKAANGTKRKADEQTSPVQSKRPEKDQKTLEETMNPSDDVDEGFDEEMRDDEPVAQQNGQKNAKDQGSIEEVNAGDQVEEPKQKENEKDNEQRQKNGDESALDQVKADETDEGTTSKVSFDSLRMRSSYMRASLTLRVEREQQGQC